MYTSHQPLPTQVENPLLGVVTPVVGTLAGVAIIVVVILAVIIAKILCGEKKKELKFGRAFNRQYNDDDDGVNQVVDDDDKNSQLIALLADERQRLMDLNRDLSARSGQEAYRPDAEALSGFKMVASIKELQRENRNLRDWIERSETSENADRRLSASVVIPASSGIPRTRE